VADAALPAGSERRHFGDAAHEKQRFFTEPFAHKWSVGFEGRKAVCVERQGSTAHP
jgi:hypothetical protein